MWDTIVYLPCGKAGKPALVFGDFPHDSLLLDSPCTKFSSKL